MSVARSIPVFRPTEEEFSDFSKYVTSIEPIAEQFGICKIVPPEGWRPRISSYDDIDIEIPCPIRQFVHGKQGVYQVVNVMEKPMTLAQFKQASDEQFSKCFPKSTREGSDAEKFDIEELERRFWKNLTFHAPLYGADMLGTLFEDSEEEREEEEDSDEVEVVDDPPARGKKNASPKRKRSDATEEAEVDKKERRHNAWNLGHLDTLLSQRLGKLLPGVTSPYLYFGMWKSLFACHTEDMDLYSINFLHFGKPKVWYGVPSSQKHRVDQVARLHFPMQFKECPEFLRHKSSMFSPSILKMGNVLLTHAVQQPGEFIITFPGAYHFGFNAGFNCAEAVNFALQRWLDFGKKAKPCKCVADSVRIDVGMFINMVANGQEVPEVPPAPSAKKLKAAAPSKKKVKPRIAKRKAKEKPAAKPDTKPAAKPATKAKAKAAVATVLGGRSMGMVTAGRMMPVPPRTSAAVPEPPMFFEDMLGDDEDIPLFSDDELRSGDENDGGEYLEGSTSRHKQAKKPRRSKRVENKRNAVADDEYAAASEAPASSKARTKESTAPALPERPHRQKRTARTTPAAVVPEGTPGNAVGEAPVEPAVALSGVARPEAQKKKRAAKRQNAKVENHFQKRAAKREHPSTEESKPEPEAAAGVSTREYQGLKIIIRPPRADSRANSGSDAQQAPDPKARAHKRRNGVEPGKRVRAKKSTTANGGGGSHNGSARKGKKAHPDLMPEGKTTAWHQLNAEANHQHNRDHVGGDHLALTRERTSATTTTTTTTTMSEYGAGQSSMPPHVPSTYFVPYVPESPERRYSGPSYGHFLVGERTTHNQDGHFRAERAEQRPQPVHVDYQQGQGAPDQLYAPSQQYPPPTLRDFLSTSPVGYPQLPSLSVARQGLAPSAYGSASTMGSGGHDYSLALELQRQKLKELKEKRQQLQQQRLEQQPQLQQLHQFIQAQRQLHQQPQPDSSAASLHGMSYGSAGRYAPGLPPPVSSFSPTSAMSPYPSSIASSPYGIPLPSPLSSSPPAASGLPPPQHFGLPPHLASHHHFMERLAPAPPTTADAAGTGKGKLVPILPSPSPGLAAIYTPRSAPSAAPVAAPSTFPVSS